MFARVYTCVLLQAYTYFAAQFLCSIAYILSILTKSLISGKDIKIKTIGVTDQNESFILFWVIKISFRYYGNYLRVITDLKLYVGRLYICNFLSSFKIQNLP
jgi:hypothetical protein